MNYLFKELTRNDIHIMKEVVNEMPFYFQHVVEISEFLIDDPHSYLYGIFLNKQLLGFANFRRKTTDYSWIESVRVNTKKQLKGIGTALFRHGVEKAIDERDKIIAYATEAGNQGSCNIGRKLGFQIKEEMKPLWIETKEVNLDEKDIPEINQISNNEAFELLLEISENQLEDICLGWEYGPIDIDFFNQIKDLTFYAKE